MNLYFIDSQPVAFLYYVCYTRTEGGDRDVSTAQNRKTLNYQIDYKAERALFARFSLTLIPLFAFLAWVVGIGMIPNGFVQGLDYGKTWFVVFFLPAILYEAACIVLGIFFSLKIHKRQDIKLPLKIFICIASLLGFGLCYLTIYVFLIIRLIGAWRQWNNAD